MLSIATCFNVLLHGKIEGVINLHELLTFNKFIRKKCPEHVYTLLRPMFSLREYNL